jgi:bacterioferritin-associated ferredoxin
MIGIIYIIYIMECFLSYKSCLGNNKHPSVRRTHVREGSSGNRQLCAVARTCGVCSSAARRVVGQAVRQTDMQNTHRLDW